LSAATIGLETAIAEADDLGEAAMRMSLAHLSWSRAHYPAARAGFEVALRLFPSCGWPAGENALLGNLAGVCRNLGDLVRAEAILPRALRNNRALGSTGGEANNLANLASLAIDRGAFAQPSNWPAPPSNATSATGPVMAGRASARPGASPGRNSAPSIRPRPAWKRPCANTAPSGSATVRAIGEWNTLAHSRLPGKAGPGARDAADLDRAASFVDEALRLSSTIGDGGTEAEALNTRSSIRLALGDLRGALHDAATGRTTAAGAGYLLGEIEALIRIVEAAVHDGDTASALAAAEGAATLHRGTGVSLVEGSVALAMARARLAAHDPAATRHHAVRASRVFDDRGPRRNSSSRP